MSNYLQRDGFTSRTVDHEEISGLLVSGTIAPGDADWCAPLGGLVGMTVAEQNRTSFALLLVRTDKAVYGLTFGLGCTRPSPLPEFEFITQVRPLNPKSERALRLDDQLTRCWTGPR